MADTNVPLHQAGGDIEADDQQDEGAGSDAGSATTSLKSSVLNYVMENGLRYHAYQKGHYNFPTMRQNWIEAQRILDLGTDSGIWAVEMADEFPSAHVRSIDLSPVQPLLVPTKCGIMVDDFEQEWTDPEGTFDLVHGRCLVASVTDYSRLFRQVYKATKPGGYFELHDMDCGSYCDDGTLKQDSSAIRCGELLREGCQKVGRAVLPLECYKPLMEEAGFMNVQVMLLKRPHNQWAKDPALKRIGAYALVNHLNGIQGFTIGLLTRVLGWKVEDVDSFNAECIAEWMNKKLHRYQKLIAVYGQKPESNEST